MPRNVNLTVTTTVPAILPPGIAAGLLRLSILNTLIPPTVVATQDVSGDTALFTGINNGSYIAVAQQLDTTGANLGASVNQPFVVIDLLFNAPLAPLSVAIS